MWSVAALLWLLLLPRLLVGCGCVVSRSVCQMVAASNFVFIGTVQTVQPVLFDRFNSSDHASLQNPAIVRLQKDTSKAALRELKDRYLKLLFDLPDAEKLRVESAATQQELQAVMAWIKSEGTNARFQVQTVFQSKTDDDSNFEKDGSGGKDDKKGKLANLKSADVWTQLDDCGILFQKGETYLVYANDDEQTGRFETNVCMGTARLSDVGDDLAYLHFFQSGGARSLRLEGFVTSSFDQLHLDPLHYSAKIKSPVFNVVVALKSSNEMRYSEPDPNGRFVFDGLAEGDYQLSVFEGPFPDVVEKLSGPKTVHLQAGRCNMTALLVLLQKPAR